MNKEAKHAYQFGPFRLDASERTLHHGHEPVPLTLKAFDVLLVLVRNSGHVLSKDELMNAVWADAAVEESNLSQNIYVLRKALGQNTNGQEFIETVPRLGYRFALPVLEIRAEESEVALGKQSPARTAVGQLIAIDQNRGDGYDSEEEPPPNESQRTLFPKRRRRFWGLTIVIALVASAFIYFYVAPPTVASIAVMPFVNATGEGEAEYLSDGIAENVIDDLAQLPEVRVMARSTAFRFKVKEDDPRQMGRTLNVAAVLTGKVSREGEAWVLKSELVDVSDGKQLWGKRYLRGRDELVGLHAEISRDLAARFHWGRIRSEQTPANPEAYELYLKSKFYFSRRTPADIEKAVVYGRRAIEIDPQFAAPYAFLAWIYIFSGCTIQDCGASEATAESFAEEALRLDPGQARPHVVLGALRTYRLEWAEARREFRRSMELSPSERVDRAPYAFLYLIPQGHYGEAVEEFKSALAKDPYEPVGNANLAWALFCAGKDKEAEQILRKTLEFNPDVPLLYRRLSWVYAFQGRYKEAAASLIKGDPSVQFPPGELDLAMYWRTRLQFSSDDLFTKAYAYAALGEKVQALDTLEKGFQQGQGRLAPWIRAPLLNSLHSEPRYLALMDKLRLPILER
jgi:DNA-binding winged helix-turn-helix (wHTH) protein/TolB-like protein